MRSSSSNSLTFCENLHPPLQIILLIERKRASHILIIDLLVKAAGKSQGTFNNILSHEHVYFEILLELQHLTRQQS